MSKLTWRTSEIIAFLEESIIDGTATESMEIIYQDYKWFNKIDRKSNEWKSVIRKIKKLHNEEF
ncbi:hypothetical protein [uncultured Metabacillus sp.]|uniref:hypothetical protein n=1 Tax=uncultured Metabacillus sp. TaxID=2860135 RepID=UPI00262212DC|nr:hypothetical protein [uncultured Metabacillus sp.]